MCAVSKFLDSVDAIKYNLFLNKLFICLYMCDPFHSFFVDVESGHDEKTSGMLWKGP